MGQFSNQERYLPCAYMMPLTWRKLLLALNTDPSCDICIAFPNLLLAIVPLYPS